MNRRAMLMTLAATPALAVPTPRGAWYRMMREVGALSVDDVRRLEGGPPFDGMEIYKILKRYST